MGGAPAHPALIDSRSPWRPGASEANRLSRRRHGSCDGGDGSARIHRKPAPGLQFVASRPTARRGSYPAKRRDTGLSSHDASRPGRKYEYPCLIYLRGRRGEELALKSIPEGAKATTSGATTK